MKLLEWKRSSYYGNTVEEVMKKKTGLSLTELNQTIHQNLHRVEEMAEALLSIKDNLETVYLLGDYDVDGIKSSPVSYTDLDVYKRQTYSRSNYKTGTK